MKKIVAWIVVSIVMICVTPLVLAFATGAVIGMPVIGLGWVCHWAFCTVIRKEPDSFDSVYTKPAIVFITAPYTGVWKMFTT